MAFRMNRLHTVVTRDAEARLEVSQAEDIQKRCCPWLLECMARRTRGRDKEEKWFGRVWNPGGKME